MSHLEDLLVEYYDWQGYIVRRNIKVGRLAHGGWEGELDLVAYKPGVEEVLHLEPSLDAHPWAVRERRFTKKFEAGRKHIATEVFPWLGQDLRLRQVAILVGRGTRTELAGGEVRTVDECLAVIKAEVAKRGIGARAAISERYPLLRTIQLVVCGYYRQQATPGDPATI